MSESKVRVRFAPSPTGYPHVGNIRTALFNWLFARHSGGSFIVRIEDTDVNRKVEGATEAILDGLRWLGIDWDEGPEVGGNYGPYFQSQRLEHYQRIVRQLVEGDHAYPCYCSEERLAQMRKEMAERNESMRSYDRHCRDLSLAERTKLEAQGITPVIRFKTPLKGETRFNDLIKGEMVFDNSTLDDFVLLKSDGYPTYHLANIVDDHFMEISHVLRAEEWLSSTPRHVLLYRALGWQPPHFAHLPMILGPDKSKLSKRHGATAINEYMDRGYLPEAMINFLALLGWSLDDRTEIMTVEEIIKNFSIERVSKTAAVFNIAKLEWMNGMYIRALGPRDFSDRSLPFVERGLPTSVKRPIDAGYLTQIAPLVQERAKLLSEVPSMVDFFFSDVLEYESSLLPGKLEKRQAIDVLKKTLQALEGIEGWRAGDLETSVRPLAEGLGLKAGPFFTVLRVAITGRTASPPLFETMEVLGRDRCMARLKVALDRLEPDQK